MPGIGFLFTRYQPEQYIPHWVEKEFSDVVPRHGSVHPDAGCHHARQDDDHLHCNLCPHLLLITLEIGFRRVAPSRDQPTLHLDHTSYHEWALETAFSSDDVKVLADAMSVWIVDGHGTPPGSYVRYLSKRAERAEPLSPRLRLASIHFIDRTWDEEFKVSGLEAVRWLNHLDVSVDDMVEKGSWAWRLVTTIRSPMGLESLSSHYWRLLDKLVVDSKLDLYLESRDTEVMRSLEEAEDWEKLGVWMVVVWSLLPESEIPESESLESIEELTLKSLFQQPSALPRFENLLEAGTLTWAWGKLQCICDQARTTQLALEPLPPP